MYEKAIDNWFLWLLDATKTMQVCKQLEWNEKLAKQGGQIATNASESVPVVSTSEHLVNKTLEFPFIISIAEWKGRQQTIYCPLHLHIFTC